LVATLPCLIQTQEFGWGGQKKRFVKELSLPGPWAFAVKMLNLRKNYPVLRAENIKLIEVNREEVWAYWKQLQAQKALVVINASAKKINPSLVLPPALLKDLKKEERDLISGEKIKLDREGNEIKLALPPYQARIFVVGK